MNGPLHRGRSALLAAALLCAAPPLRAEPRGPDGAAALHRFGAGASRLRLSGETDARDLPVVLTAAEARGRARLHIVYANAVSVMAEASRLRVRVNDVAVAEAPIASPDSADPQVLDVELPPSLLEPGVNAVRIEVQQRHRVDCSLGATYELWTQVDPARSGLVFDGLGAPAVDGLAELGALRPAADGTVPLRIVVPKGIDAAGLARLLKAAEAVALRGRFTHPDVDVVSAPADRPGLDIVAGTAADLKAAGLGDLLPEDGRTLSFRPGATAGQALLVASGVDAGEVDAALASLLPGPDDVPAGTPAGVRAAMLVGGRPVEGGSTVSLRDLGVASQEFSGRLFRTGFDILLPPDFYAADYGKMTLRVDAGYAAGLAKGSQILVRVNDRDAASLPLNDPAGDVFQGRPITVPLSYLRPGYNHVGVEAELGTGDDRACEAAATVAGRKRFVLLDSTTVEMPSIARIARMPSLSATAASGFPYVGRPQGAELYLPHPDADAIGAAATFLSRAAVAAGLPVDVSLLLGRGQTPRGSALVVGALADVPAPVIEAVGLDAAAMRDGWSHIEARSAVSARLKEARSAAGAGAEDGAPPEAAGGSGLYRRWSDDVSAGRWRFEPSRFAADLLQKVAGLGEDNLPRWNRDEAAVAVTPEMRLLVAQHEAPGGAGATWTLLTAPSGEALRASVRALADPTLWNQLDGRAATLDPRKPRLGIVPARRDYFIPTAALSPGNLRLIAAGWLSSSIDVYVPGFLLLALLLGIATSGAVKRFGVKP